MWGAPGAPIGRVPGRRPTALRPSRPHARRPHAFEAHVVAVFPHDAGGARVFVIAGAMVSRPGGSEALVVRRPRDDAAGVVAGEGRPGTPAAGQQRGGDHYEHDRFHQAPRNATRPTLEGRKSEGKMVRPALLWEGDEL